MAKRRRLTTVSSTQDQPTSDSDKALDTPPNSLSANDPPPLNFWLDSWRRNAPSNGLQKLGIISGILLALISAVLAYIALQQQTDIKGMADLLAKQDQSIDFLKNIVNQNKTLLASQAKLLKQLSQQTISIADQTKENLEATKPQINIHNQIVLTGSDDPRVAKVKIEVKNYGQREARNVRMMVEWFLLNKGEIRYKVLNTYVFPEPMGAEEINTFELPMPSISATLKYFSNAYVVARIDYIDSRTKNKEVTLTMAKQSFAQNQNGQIGFIRTHLVGYQRDFVLKAIRSKQLLEKAFLGTHQVIIPPDTSSIYR